MDWEQNPAQVRGPAVTYGPKGRVWLDGERMFFAHGPARDPDIVVWDLAGLDELSRQVHHRAKPVHSAGLVQVLRHVRGYWVCYNSVAKLYVHDCGCSRQLVRLDIAAVVDGQFEVTDLTPAAV